MFTCISMLRGINVGRQKRIKMAELIAVYQSLGFEAVKTYAQSGNVIFNSPRSDMSNLSELIEARLRQMFNISIAGLLRNPGELQGIVSNNPFLKENGLDIDRLYVTFLSKAPAQETLAQADMRSGRDKFVMVDREIYLYCPNGYGRTRFSNDFFEKRLAISATTRNWRTVNILLGLVST